MSKNLNKVTGAGLLIALGIIYGDIGTSPLYVFNAIINDRVITEDNGKKAIIGTFTQFNARQFPAVFQQYLCEWSGACCIEGGIND